MTANRIITAHEELDNSGVVAHSKLDELAEMQLVVTSGSFGNSRQLVRGVGVNIVDDGEFLTVSAQMSWMEVPVAGANNTFILQHVPSPAMALMFFVNGVLQTQGVDNDYTLTDNIVTIKYSCKSNNIVATYPW